jgi:hypothetical protein
MHIFINSKKYPATIMKKFIGSAQYKELSVNPFDPKNVELEILKTISELPTAKHIGFNLTGGTKLMFAGALAASNKVNGVPFYFETNNNNLIYLTDFTFAQAKPIDNVETFFRVNTNNFSLSNKGFWNDDPGRNSPERTDLTNKLWRNRNKIVKLYTKLRLYNDNPGKIFDIEKGKIHAILHQNGKAEILIGDEKSAFPNWPDFAEYLSGGWLEEYTYLTLEPLLKSGLIKDLRIGMEISIKDNNDNKNIDWKDQLRNIHGELYQEIDIVFTNGKSLYIIECKAGNVRTADVMKLQNIVSHFGGVEGKGLLISAFKPYNNVVRRKINEARNVNLIFGQDFPKILKNMFS